MADSTRISKNILPQSPFDGQVLIDAFRNKWRYDGSTNCWKMVGNVTDIPAASEIQSGLLSAKLKQFLDSIPPKAGSFGIVTKPLLSVVPFSRDPLLTASVVTATQNESGSEIVVNKALEVNAYAAKVVYFTTGVLKNKYYMIYANTENIIYIEGSDASAAKKNDKFDIVEPLSLNKDGVIQGDIELVSDSLEISCVDSEGNLIEDECPTLERIVCDDPDNPPGLDIKVSDRFLEAFCVQIPGCVGPKGDRGPDGAQGAPGTGDGPVGDDGDVGLDADTTPQVLTDVDILDIQDVYDTAVVGLELDAANGKLNVVKAKIKVPTDDKAADKVISTALYRDIEFIDSEWGYKISMPQNDPIGDGDVPILHYPEGFEAKDTLAANRINETEVNTIGLSKLIDDAINYWDAKLQEASDKFDFQIKPYIEQKDEEARKILYGLADEVARCEWEMPIEFCLGILPNDCHPDDNVEGLIPLPMAAALLGEAYDKAIAAILDIIDVPGIVEPHVPPAYVTPIEQPPVYEEPNKTPITTNDIVTQTDNPNTNVNTNTTNGLNTGTLADRQTTNVNTGNEILVKDLQGNTLLQPAAYIFTYVSGAVRTDETMWNAQVQIDYKDQTGNSGTTYIREPSTAALNNFDSLAYERSMQDANELDTAAVVELQGPGEIKLSLKLPGSVAEGSIRVRAYQVFQQNNFGDIQAPIVQTIIRDAQGPVTGGGSLGGINIPDCGQTVDCGDVNCPDTVANLSIVAVTPDNGPATGGTIIKISGTGFQGPEPTSPIDPDTPKVYIGGESVNVLLVSLTQITVNTPPTSLSGPQDVVVEIPITGQSVNAPNAFEYT